MAPLQRAFAMLLLAGLAATQKTCGEQESCTEISVEAAKGSAMLQIHAAPAGDVQGKAAPSHVTDGFKKMESRCSLEPMKSTYLLESRSCLPNGLQEAHLHALRRHALFLATKKTEEKKVSMDDTTLSSNVLAGENYMYVDDLSIFNAGDEIRIEPGTPNEEVATVDQVQFGMVYLVGPVTSMHLSGSTVEVGAPATSAGATAGATAATPAATSGADAATASLDAAGFKLVTSLCCPADMETFFNRLLAARNLQICSKVHIQGLMHWFSCVPDMDFNYILDIINNGNPCKYWAPIGSTCSALSPECEGKWCR